jgi:hypothetical protein
MEAPGHVVAFTFSQFYLLWNKPGCIEPNIDVVLRKGGGWNAPAFFAVSCGLKQQLKL